MTLLEFAILLLVAAVCGAVGQAIAGVSRGGCLVSIVIGFVGALLGRWLAGALDLPPVFVIHVGDSDFPIVWSVIGASLFVAVIVLLTGARRERR